MNEIWCSSLCLLKGQCHLLRKKMRHPDMLRNRLLKKWSIGSLLNKCFRLKLQFQTRNTMKAAILMRYQPMVMAEVPMWRNLQPIHSKEYRSTTNPHLAENDHIQTYIKTPLLNSNRRHLRKVLWSNLPTYLYKIIQPLKSYSIHFLKTVKTVIDQESKEITVEETFHVRLSPRTRSVLYFILRDLMKMQTLCSLPAIYQRYMNTSTSPLTLKGSWEGGSSPSNLDTISQKSLSIEISAVILLATEYY